MPVSEDVKRFLINRSPSYTMHSSDLFRGDAFKDETRDPRDPPPFPVQTDETVDARFRDREPRPRRVFRPFLRSCEDAFPVHLRSSPPFLRSSDLFAREDVPRKGSRERLHAKKFRSKRTERPHGFPSCGLMTLASESEVGASRGHVGGKSRAIRRQIDPSRRGRSCTDARR